MFSKLLILNAELDGLFILTEMLGASQTAYSYIPEDENPSRLTWALLSLIYLKRNAVHQELRIHLIKVLKSGIKI